LDDKDYRDPDTGALWDLDILEDALMTIERPAKIHNARDFRSEVVRFALRCRAENDGANPKWTEWEPFKRVVEKELFSKTEDLLPVISFRGSKKSDEDQDKHNSFVKKMIENG